eukprot:3552324-Pleurochrysis_carterae.AAC.1
MAVEAWPQGQEMGFQAAESANHEVTKYSALSVAQMAKAADAQPRKQQIKEQELKHAIEADKADVKELVTVLAKTAMVRTVVVMTAASLVVMKTTTVLTASRILVAATPREGVRIGAGRSPKWPTVEAQTDSRVEAVGWELRASSARHRRVPSPTWPRSAIAVVKPPRPAQVAACQPCARAARWRGAALAALEHSAAGRWRRAHSRRPMSVEPAVMGRV